MNNIFTVHCIAWQAGATLLQDVRVAASEMGLMDKSEALADKLDEQCRHALALSTSGKAIGCARITQGGHVDRMAVLQHGQRVQIETALIEVLKDYTYQLGSKNLHVACSKG